MTTFSKLVTGIVSDLHQGGFNKDADELQDLTNTALDQNLSTDTKKSALRQIEMRCHVKWFGDFYLSNLSQKEWWRKLDELANLTRKYMRSI